MSTAKLTASDVLQRYSSEDLPEFVELVLRDVNQRGNFGNTPLHVAAVRGEVDEMQALLRAGALVDAVGENGNTALHEAALQGHAGAVKALLDAGADLTVRNANGKTASELAAHLGRAEVVKLLGAP